MSDETTKEETAGAETAADEVTAAAADEVTAAAADEVTETAAEESTEEEAPAAEAASEEPPAAEAETAAEPEATASAEGEASAEEAPAAEASAEAPVAEADTEAPAAEADTEAPAEEPAAPEYDYHTLHGMNVAQLREVAATIEHDAVHGYTTMHKEHLVPAICKALGIEAHEHHEVVGIDKDAVKAKIRLLKVERDEAEAAGDSARLKLARRRIRSLKRKIRKATV